MLLCASYRKELILEATVEKLVRVDSISTALFFVFTPLPLDFIVKEKTEYKRIL